MSMVASWDLPWPSLKWVFLLKERDFDRQISRPGSPSPFGSSPVMTSRGCSSWISEKRPGTMCLLALEQTKTRVFVASDETVVFFFFFFFFG